MGSNESMHRGAANSRTCSDTLRSGAAEACMPSSQSESNSISHDYFTLCDLWVYNNQLNILSLQWTYKDSYGSSICTPSEL